MKKTVILLALAALALTPSLEARHKAKKSKMEILRDEGFHTLDYSKLVVGKVSANKLKDSLGDRPHYRDIADTIDDMDDALAGELEGYAKKDFRGGKRGKVLRVSAIMTDFSSGSAAAAVWVGMGAGNGRCTYKVVFWDGKKEVAAFETTQSIRRNQHGGWGRQDFSGQESRDQIIDTVVDLVDDFLNDH